MHFLASISQAEPVPPGPADTSPGTPYASASRLLVGSVASFVAAAQPFALAKIRSGKFPDRQEAGSLSSNSKFGRHRAAPSGCGARDCCVGSLTPSGAPYPP